MSPTSTPGDKSVTAALLLIALAAAATAHADETLASVGSALVTRDGTSNTWTIGNPLVALTVEVDAKTGFHVVAWRDGARGTPAPIDAAPDAVLTVNGSRFAVGARSNGFAFGGARAMPLANGVRLDITFELRDPEARVTRSYVCYEEAAAIEMWTAVEATGRRLTLGDITVWQIATSRGEIRWQTGLQAGSEAGGPFTIERRTLASGERLVLGATQRASEKSLPVFAMAVDRREMFAGLMWSGAWAGALEADDTRLHATLGLDDFETEVAAGSRFESPHAFVGLSADEAATSAALTRFALAIRNGRAFPALVAYNTWFAYGTRVEEETVLEEMERVAPMGVEVFVLDAGWYPGSGRDGVFDFTPGVGALAADEQRFPTGLAALSRRAHDLGMKFGIWVEPARSAVSLVGTADGPEEPWLASRGGDYAPGAESAPVAAQICLAGAAGRRWVLDRLTAFIAQTNIDYLKWDNNFFVNCDRDGHGHGSRDGNFRHQEGLYEILAALRERFPDLLIENVSGGGNLIDFGILRYSDVAWMDDRSAPSAHVRHNLDGLSAFYPPAYLLSFVMGNEEEPLHSTPDMAMLVRSRMPGVLGLTFRSNELAESESEELTRQIGMYKFLRGAVQQASAALLSPQPPDRAEGEWDVLQERAATGDVLLFAFQQPGGGERVVVRPVGLAPNARYAVESIDRGQIGEATGRQLMDDGIEVIESPVSAAHILVLRIQRPIDER